MKRNRGKNIASVIGLILLLMGSEKVFAAPTFQLVTTTDENGNVVSETVVDENGKRVDVDASSERVDQVKIKSGLSSYYNGRCYAGNIEDQGSSSLCWTYGFLSTMESDLKMQTGETYDLSERQVAWFSKRPKEAQNQDGENLEETLVWKKGGSYRDAAFTVFSGTGAIEEEACGFTYTQDGEDIDYETASVEEELRNVFAYSIEKVERIGGKGVERQYAVKEAILKNGAVGTSLRWEKASYYNPTRYTYYYNGNADDTNHAVSIVGWDDNYSRNNFRKKPSQDGAWLVKSSWGMDFGMEGYFYVSYEDKYCGVSDTTYYVQAEAQPDYDTVYQYDACNTSTAILLKDTKAANIFTAKENGKLKKIGIGTIGTYGTYEISVYTGTDMSSPEDGTLQETCKYTLDNNGFFVLPLEKTLSIKAGEQFAVVVSSTNTGSLNIEQGEQYHSEAGVSYLYEDGSWSDVTTTDFGNPDIKAMVETVEEKQPIKQEEATKDEPTPLPQEMDSTDDNVREEEEPNGKKKESEEEDHTTSMAGSTGESVSKTDTTFVTAGKLKYKVTNEEKHFVTIVGVLHKKGKTLKIPTKIKIKGISYQVKGIKKNIFDVFSPKTTIKIPKKRKAVFKRYLKKAGFKGKIKTF